MTGSSNHHWRRIVEQRQRQPVTGCAHGITGRPTSIDQLAVIAAAEHAGTAADQQRGVRLRRLGNGREQLFQHAFRERVDLAVVQPDFGNAIGNGQLQRRAHALASPRASSRSTRRSSLPTVDLGRSSRISTCLGIL